METLAPRWSTLVLFASACATTRTQPPTPEPPSPPAVVDAGVAVVDAPPAPPAIDPCAEGPAHDALAALESGHTLTDRRARLLTMGATVADMSGWFPAVREGGFDVVSITPADGLGAGTYFALLSQRDAALEPDFDPSLGLLRCEPGRGWTLVAAPFHVPFEGLPRITSVRSTALPGGATGATVTLREDFVTTEANATAYLFASATPTLPVREPRGATLGVVGVVGTVGETVVVEGMHGEHRTLSPFDATGWFPIGQGQVFVRVVRERAPNERGGWDDGVLARPMATVDAQGFHEDSDASAVWLYVGAGAPPAWCETRRDLRCAPLTMGGATGLAAPYTWVAGAWSTDAPPPRDLRAPGGRWFYAGSWDGDRPPRGPDGRAPLTAIPVREPAAPRR